MFYGIYSARSEQYKAMFGQRDICIAKYKVCLFTFIGARIYTVIFQIIKMLLVIERHHSYNSAGIASADNRQAMKVREMH
jgi:hypothetical protein